MLFLAVYSLALAISAVLAASDRSNNNPSPPPKQPSPPPKQPPLPTKKEGLEQIEHIVLFMQENRAFDHYYGSLAGVRGFGDPNVQINPLDAKEGLLNVFYQHVDSTLTNKTNYLLPFYLNHHGGDFFQATQCATAGTNSFEANLAADNLDLNNLWPIENNPYSWGSFRRRDLPVHYAIADTWTIADMYQESIVAATHPNRAMMFSGSANIPGGKVAPDLGGPVMDDNEFTQCEKLGLSDMLWNCFPYKWKTTAEYLEDAGVSWRIYQPNANLVDNGCFYFQNFQDAAMQTPPGPLAIKGLNVSGPTQLSFIDQFRADAEAGTLAAVTYIVPQDQLTEHPPKRPQDGAWQQREIINALTHSKSYKNTLLIITYDETGGWGDHVPPFHSPPGTPGEWMVNPFTLNQTFTGPGYRVPTMAISPWTRGGKVFTESCDHISQIFLLEQWLKVKGKDITSAEINDWRREHMCDFTDIFDFANPDFSVPELPSVPFPPFNNATNQFDGDIVCEAMFPVVQPEIPYGEQDPATALWVESGFRQVIGILTEGRYLVFEEASGSKNLGLSVSDSHGRLTLTSSSVPTQKESDVSHRFIIHTQGIFPQSLFQLQTGVATSSASYLNSKLEFVTKAQAATFSIEYDSVTQTYTLQDVSSKKFISVSSKGEVELSSSSTAFSVFSVTFN